MPDNIEGTRRKARRAALDLLFEAHVRSLPIETLLAERLVQGKTAGLAAGSDAEKPIRPYTVEIVSGVGQNLERIDELLTTYSTRWPVERMPNVDRELLHMGVWEILYNDEVPDFVAIDEAVALAASFSTDDSPGFINALLDRIAKLKPMLLE